MFMRVVRVKAGMKFSDSHKSVDAVFFLGGTRDVRLLHLKTIAAIAAIFEQHNFEKKWMEAVDSVELKNLLILNERKRYF